MMRGVLEAGKKAPDFRLKDQNGENVALSDYSGKTVVLYFYPKANTSGCTTQACGVRDRMDEYRNAGATVIGVSPDEVKAISKFDDEYGFGFTLLADKDHKVAEKYGTWVEKSMYGNTYMGVQRATFIIGPDGKIARVFPKVQPKKHDDVVLKALVEINTTA
jgi:peroxiredoxin Q/BCP